MSEASTLTTPWPWDEITAWPSDVGPMTGSWSANQYFDDRATLYIRADVSAARIADLDRQLAEARGEYRKGWRFAYNQWDRTGSVPNPDYTPDPS